MMCKLYEINTELYLVEISCIVKSSFAYNIGDPTFSPATVAPVMISWTTKS